MNVFKGIMAPSTTTPAKIQTTKLAPEGVLNITPFDSELHYYDITHWMPLPEPPQVVKIQQDVEKCEDYIEGDEDE